MTESWVWKSRRPRDEIVTGVWVGDHHEAVKLHRRKGWTVIDVREMDTEKNPPSVVSIPVLAGKRGAASLGALCRIADAIDEARARGDQVFVHCWMGVERSPLSIVGWLVLREGYTFEEAYDLVKYRRAVADRRKWLSKKAAVALGLTTGVPSATLVA